MSELQNNQGPQGRIDLPLPRQEEAARLQGPIVLDADDLAASQPWSEPPGDADSVVHRALGQRRIGLLGWGLAGVGLLSVVELGLFVWHSLADSWLWGGLWCAALGALGLGVLRILGREFMELRLLKRRQDTQSRAQELVLDDVPDGARAFCSQLAVDTRAECTQGYATWQQQCESHYSSREQLQLYSRLVLSEQDKHARASVMRWSGEAAVLVTISPLASVDMLLILWRSLKMIDEVAACYGIRLGYWSRIRLLRMIGQHMLYAGAAELITDVGLDWLGAELSARLSARLAQGVGAGLLTVRLGLQTMQVCRPIAFTQNEKPRLGQFRAELVSMLTSKLGSVLTGGNRSKNSPQEQEAVSTANQQGPME